MYKQAEMSWQSLPIVLGQILFGVFAVIVAGFASSQVIDYSLCAQSQPLCPHPGVVDPVEAGFTLLGTLLLSAVSLGTAVLLNVKERRQRHLKEQELTSTAFYKDEWRSTIHHLLNLATVITIGLISLFAGVWFWQTLIIGIQEVEPLFAAVGATFSTCLAVVCTVCAWRIWMNWRQDIPKALA